MDAKIYIVWQDEVGDKHINEFADTADARVEARECLNFIESDTRYEVQKIIIGKEINKNDL